MKSRFRDFARALPRGLTLAFVVGLVLLLVLGLLRAHNADRRMAAVEATFRHLEVNDALGDFLSALKDAEGGQRGFLLTGDRAFLMPYDTAQTEVPRNLARLRALAEDDPRLNTQVSTLAGLSDDKMAELRATLDLTAAGRTDEALALVRAGRGRELMEQIRRETHLFVAQEENRAAGRRAKLERRRRVEEWLEPAVVVLALGLLIGTFVSLLRQFARTRRAEAGLRESHVKLEVANEELRSFAYSVAHDLRAPLRAINGFAGVLNEDHAAQLDADARRVLERITANGTRMSQLIDDLLALARVSAREFQPRRIEMAGLVREVCAELVGGLERAPETVELSVSGELPPAAGDPSMIRQVWVNLLANALKFTRGRAPARIEIGGTSAGADFVTYFVRDNGAGFNMKYLGRLFAPFQRLHQADEFEGTGIGLALVKRIVQRHGGAVWAEGTEGQGALFAFTLPEWAGK